MCLRASSLALSPRATTVRARRNERSRRDRLASAAPPAAAEATRHSPIPDPDIAAAIERHFLDEPLLRSEHVKAVVTQGVAVLSGVVGNLEAKERAVGVAETIKGVEIIVDEISVAPVARSDLQLESDVTSALQHDSATRRYTIGVATKGGTVTLSGRWTPGKKRM